MQKTLLLTLFVVCFQAFSWAQCQPDPQYTQDGIYPDPSTLNATIPVDQYYEQILTVNAPDDTTIIVSPLNIDSVVINNILNLPPGIGVSCVPNACSWLGGESGCVNISGTPTQTGTYDVELDISVFVQSLPQAIPVTETYTVIVDANASVEDQDLLAESKIFPNPAQNQAQLQIKSKRNDLAKIEVVDVIGNTVLFQQQRLQAGTNSIPLNLNELAEGQYFVRIEQQNALVVKKLLVVR